MFSDLQDFISNPILILAVIISLDLLFGDPKYSFHPVRIIAKLQVFYENKLRIMGHIGKIGGIILVLLMVVSTLVFFIIVNNIFLSIHWIIVWVWYVYLGWSFLALRDLINHSKNISRAMENRNLTEARLMVSLIVGRETKKMDMNACGRATIESVSENLNDGVIAPLFYYCFFGINGMLVYKLFNTLDSMIGYKNDRYVDFGWFAAKIDDYLSWAPARISWILLSLTAFIFPGFSGLAALKVGLRDYSKLNSPNAGWCEATAAGALKIKLCGPIWREGKLDHNFWLGDSFEREGATFLDINKMNKLAFGSALLGVLFFGVLLNIFPFIHFIEL